LYMGVQAFGTISSNASLKQVIDELANLMDTLNFLLNGKLDSVNIRNIAGFNVNKTELKHSSGIVGMSGANPGDPTAVRFWAGNSDITAAIFRVLQNGHLFASDADLTGNINALTGTIGGFTITLTKLSGAGIIEGGTVRTAAPGNARIELTNNTLKTFNASDQLQGLAWGTDTSSSTYGDAFFYSFGNKIAEFYNAIPDGLNIRPAAGSVLFLGYIGRSTHADGNWTFSNKITGSIQEADHASNADYASSSGTATAVPATGVAPGAWTKVTVAADGRVSAGTTLSASDIPTIAESQVSGLVSDLAAKAPLASFGNSLGINGYQKLAGGLILQWGQTVDVSVPSGGAVNQTFIFPLPFPTGAYQVTATLDATGASANGSYCNVYSETATGIGVVLNNTTASTQTYRARVFAIGH
jgi:hypothetical protein